MQPKTIACKIMRWFLVLPMISLLSYFGMGDDNTYDRSKCFGDLDLWWYEMAAWKIDLNFKSVK